MKKKIIIFGKAPKYGFGKSRLTLLLDEKERYDLCIQMLKQTYQVAVDTEIPVTMHFAGEKEDIAFLTDDLVIQKGEDLGARMFSALEKELQNHDAVLLIGTDLTNISGDILHQAFQQLEERDVVLSPTADGGYGLIGMKKLADVFSDITFSRSDVLIKTLQRIENLGLSVSLTEMLYDIDTPEDLVRAETNAKEVELLGYGEYNLNYRYDERFVFRINLGSQLHLGKEQIQYEFDALKQLEKSCVTPKVFDVQKKGRWIPKGFLTMEFLKGRPLNYDTDMEIAAYLLATVHNTPFEERSLIRANRPFQVMYDEFIAMFSRYENWRHHDPNVVQKIQKLLSIAKSRGLHHTIERASIINTELNNRNFIIGTGIKDSYIIDWEKPLIGECEQDLAHFTVPTTTHWKTDTILTKKQIDAFLDCYEQYRSVDRTLFDQYFMFNCLRGLTWCSMAKVEYETARDLKNEETYQKICKFLSQEFIDRIYHEFYEVYDDEK